MFQIQKLLKNPRACKALTGMTPYEIEQLALLFTENLAVYRKQLVPNRKRKLGGGQKGKLPLALQKLIFVLIYLKIYPTYDSLAFMVDLPRSKAFRWVHLLLPVLEMTLANTLSLPKRKPRNLEEVFRDFPAVKEIFIDGSERRVEKPRKPKQRNKLYSGKKKAVTRKTVIISDKHKRILAMTPTKSGRRHDKRLWDKYYDTAQIPETIEVYTDTGFQGLQTLHHNTNIPSKASKGKPLSDAQKQTNTLISSVRIIIEHAIGGYKRFKTASDIYRNKKANLDDYLTEISIGLWNFHLLHTI